MEQDKNNKMNALMAKAAADASFKAQLIENPVATLKAEEIDVPEGLEIRVLENTERVFHLVLPHRSSELSDDDLENIAGGILYT